MQTIAQQLTQPLHKPLHNCWVTVGIKQVRLTGLPIRQAFWVEPPNKVEARERLGLAVDAPTALLVGGGDGVGRLIEIAVKTAAQLSRDTAVRSVLLVSKCVHVLLHWQCKHACAVLMYAAVQHQYYLIVHVVTLAM
jgi:UDP-N-acetylglucosamine:LPS N-acetylglucosamine transferase